MSKLKINITQTFTMLVFGYFNLTLEEGPTAQRDTAAYAIGIQYMIFIS